MRHQRGVPGEAVRAVLRHYYPAGGLACETLLVHTTLPNLHPPFAMENLTTGSLFRLPRCISEGIIRPAPSDLLRGHAPFSGSTR